MSDLDLDPGQFRQLPTKPLANPRELRKGIALWALFTGLAWFAGWQLGTWWATMLPIAPAVWLGICIAGLWPKAFFSSSDT